MNWLSGIPARIKEAIGWLSIQVTLGWAVIWGLFSQLPPDVIVKLTKVTWLEISFVAWMGIVQALMTGLARMKKQKPV